jgi:uncharacterized RDD family membrane protein YckC
MSAPTPAPGDDRPREGYYPDPSIPGYVRYWNGAAWVPGTSRPAPAGGESLAPPGPASVEATGPHFFDEDPPGGQAAATPAAGAPPAAPPGTPAAPAAPATPAPPATPIAPASPVPPTAPAAHPAPAAPAPPAASGTPAAPGAQHGSRPAPAAAWGADSSRQSGFGGDQDRRVWWGGTPGADPRVPRAAEPADGPVQPDGRAARTDGSATIPPAVPDEDAAAADGSTFVFRRPVTGPGDGPGSRPGGSGAAGTDHGTMTFRRITPRTGPGGAAPAAGKAPAGQTPPSGPQQAPAAPAPNVPRQPAAPTGPARPAGAAPASPAPAPAAPVAAGPGGGSRSWAQQVHRLAGGGGADGGGEGPVTPWKPPVEDVFQAAARRQAAARPAGLGRRLAARLLDTLVLGAVTAAAAVPLGARAADHVSGKLDEARLSGETVTVWLLDGTTGLYLGIVLAVLLLTGVLYEALPTARWGRTLGKRLLGLQVRDIEGHEPPSFAVALRRWLVYCVPGLLVVGVVGVVWCLFDRPWRQCWHDKAAHTFVAG